MSTDLVHILGNSPGTKEVIVDNKPYLPDDVGFKQLLYSHDHLCFENLLKERLECFVSNNGQSKLGDYHVVCHHVVKGREEIAEFVAIKIAFLGLDHRLKELADNICKAAKPTEKEIAFREFFNVIGNRFKILIVLPNLYETTAIVPESEIMILDEFAKYCQGVKFWICGDGSWDLNHLEAYKVFFRRFDPISKEFFIAMKENKQLPVAYISYRWLGKSLDVVDMLCEQFRKNKVYYKRDKEDCQFNDSINDFMNEIREGNPVVIVFSEGYFRSYACCYELAGIFSHEDYKNRIVGILVDDSIRNDEKKYWEVVNHWEDKRKQNNDDMDSLRTDIEETKIPYKEKEINMVELIKKLPLVMSYIKDNNAMTLSYLESNSYMPVVVKVKEKMEK